MIKSGAMISSTRKERDLPLFVYGTLRPFVRIPMARWLTEAGVHLGTARTRGRLYDLGPYPGLVRARCRGDWVVGDLYRLTAPRAAFKVLDRYEGGPRGRGFPRFARRRCAVEWRGRRIAAWTYVYQPPIFSPHRVPSGDYRLHRDSR